MGELEILAGVAAMALATSFTRALPFLVFSRKTPPKILVETAPLIPGAVMTVLVLTSLPLGLPAEPGFWKPWTAALVTAVLHVFFKQPLVSILGGTGLYMFLN